MKIPVVKAVGFDRRPPPQARRAFDRVGALGSFGSVSTLGPLSVGTTEWTLTLACGHTIHRHTPIGKPAPKFVRECEAC